MTLSRDDFLHVIANAPLVSIDFIIRDGQNSDRQIVPAEQRVHGSAPTRL